MRVVNKFFGVDVARNPDIARKFIGVDAVWLGELSPHLKKYKRKKLASIY